MVRSMRSRRPLPWWLAALVVVTAATLILIPDSAQYVESSVNRAVAPIESVVSTTVTESQQIANVIRKVGDLARQNDEYRDEIDRLHSEIVGLRELEVENSDLRNMLGLKQRSSNQELAPVRVIARDPSPYVQSITIDLGTDGGIRDDMPVITWRGIVGRVSRAVGASAKVLLITDVNSSISGRVQSSESRATGIVRGRSDGGLLMQHIPQDERVQTGDTVITSDLGGVLPDGLVIGQVVQVRRKDVDVFQEALVESAADMRRLERLYVLVGQVPVRQDSR